MSTTTLVDYRGHLAGWAMMVAQLYIKDLRAISADVYTSTHGGCSRSIQSISAEVVDMTRRTADIVRGAEPSRPTDEEFEAHVASLDTKEKAEEAILAVAGSLSEAIAQATDDQLNREVMMPWGMPMSVYALCHLAVTHINYHDGQVNYIQSIHGDGEIHWL